MRVVLIDDHEVSRAACRALLQTEGVDVIHDLAADERALTDVARLAPDIVIVDSTPGDETGRDLVRRIRALGFTVLITSSSPRSDLAGLDGVPFIAKADLCRSTIQGAAMPLGGTRSGRALG